MRTKSKQLRFGYEQAENEYCNETCLRKRTIDKIPPLKSKVHFKRVFFKKENPKLFRNVKLHCKSKIDSGPSKYIIYCIVNSGFFTNKGNLVASVARGFLGLYNKLERSRVKAETLDSWEDSGEKIIILKGINHKHLKYLAKDLRYAAVDIHELYKTWGRSQIMLVLSVMGRAEDMEEYFDGLSCLR